MTPPESSNDEHRIALMRAWAAIGVSAVVLVACLAFVGWGPDATRDWAAGLVGAVVGYWLK